MKSEIKTRLEFLQNYIKENGLEKLKEHGIKIKQNKNHILLDYDQIEVKWSEPFGYLCRGLVLDKHNLNPLCMSFIKFFNAQEGYAAHIDWNSARVQEKYDGSLVCRWWDPYSNQFVYSTRFQLPEELYINKPDQLHTWKQIIDEAIHVDLNQEKFEVFVFELMTPYNIVVIPHPISCFKILTIRNLQTLEEYSHPYYKPEEYPLQSLEDVLNAAKELKGFENEGYVVVDKHYNRVKIKGPDYVAISHLKSGISTNNLALQIRTGEIDEILAYFPQYEKFAISVKNNILNFKTEVEKHWKEHKNIKVKKEFALKIKDLECRDCLFKLYDSKVKNVDQYVREISDSQYLQMFVD